MCRKTLFLQKCDPLSVQYVLQLTGLFVLCFGPIRCWTFCTAGLSTQRPFSGIFKSHNAAHWFCTEVSGLRNCSTSTHHHHFNWVHFLNFLTGWIFQITYTTSTISVFRGFFSWLRLRVKCLLNPEKIRLLIPSAFLWKVNGTSLAFRTYCITYAHLV